MRVFPEKKLSFILVLNFIFSLLNLNSYELCCRTLGCYECGGMAEWLKAAVLKNDLSGFRKVLITLVNLT